MGASLGTFDFFLLEGNEYLERLDALAQTAAGSFDPADEFVKLTRAYRGSALMANQHGMARAAQGLESAARALRDGRLQWDEGVRGEVVRAIDDCKILMRRLRTPEQGDMEKAEQLGMKLDRLSGRESAAMRVAHGPGLDAGGRAFVAREAASIGSALQNTARAVETPPVSRDALNGLIPAMSALRGVAVLNDLPPLGDILAAVEAVVKEFASGGGAGGELTDVLQGGARALARAAREVVDHGRPDPESDEARGFAARLLGAIGTDDAAPVESLFYADAGPHVVQQGTPPARSSLSRVDMVSHGEFLTAAATELSRAGSTVQRDLRLFMIAANLRPMVNGGGDPVSDALAEFATATRGAIGSGAASSGLEGFAAQVLAAATALGAAQGADERSLALRLREVAGNMAGLRPSVMPAVAGAAPAPLAPASAPAPAPPVTAAPAGAPAAAPAPVRARAPEPPAPQRGAAASAPLTGVADLAGSYMTLEQLIKDRGLAPSPLAELLAGGTAAGAGLAPRASVARPAVPAPPPAAELPVVDVGTLLYSGEAALRRALELRAEIADAAKRGDRHVDDLLREVFDLVELGLGSGR
jgi:hypothetical protein